MSESIRKAMSSTQTKAFKEPSGFRGVIAARNAPVVAQKKPTDVMRYAKCHEEEDCFSIFLGERLKDSLRDMCGLSTDHAKHQTKRIKAALANSIIMSDLRR